MSFIAQLLQLNNQHYKNACYLLQWLFCCDTFFVVVVIVIIIIIIIIIFVVIIIIIVVVITIIIIVVVIELSYSCAGHRGINGNGLSDPIILSFSTKGRFAFSFLPQVGLPLYKLLPTLINKKALPSCASHIPNFFAFF
jgi:hypothetical protein